MLNSVWVNAVDRQVYLLNWRTCVLRGGGGRGQWDFGRQGAPEATWPPNLCSPMNWRLLRMEVLSWGRVTHLNTYCSGHVHTERSSIREQTGEKEVGRQKGGCVCRRAQAFSLSALATPVLYWTFKDSHLRRPPQKNLEWITSIIILS